MRITNIDTLSTFFDRLITERIKEFFFGRARNKNSIDKKLKQILGDNNGK